MLASFTAITVGFTRTEQNVIEGEIARVCVEILNGSITDNFADVLSLRLDARSSTDVIAAGYIPAIGIHKLVSAFTNL